ncbi:MAG: TIGR04282 family arsenosugar biosynthesis glycosyltransferase [Nitrospirae bacterium]|nr:TIGR04282 family arsenosugar biosynthesis glycosyltransferase [Nitrospirota bacterium]
MSRDFYGIMIKYPDPGRVKTRLAADIGPADAAVLSREITERVMEQTTPPSGGYVRFVFYGPPERTDEFGSWLPDEKLICQRGGDIGERMHNAVTCLFDNGADKAVITGSDIPDLAKETVLQAFELLEGADVVIGPALDGGYYLIGMKSPMPVLFRDIPWSTEDVYSETVGAITRSGRSYKCLPALSDIDTVEGLRSYLKEGSIGTLGSARFNDPRHRPKVP